MIQEPKIQSRVVPDENKFYLGTYLNTARHNAFLVLKHISEKLEFDDDHLDEDKLYEAEALKMQSSKKVRATDIQKKVDALLYHFPAFEYLALVDEAVGTRIKKGEKEIDPKKLQTALEAALKLLNKLRNQNSHYYYAATIKAMDIEPIFQQAIHGVINRFPDITEADTEYLKQYKLTKDDEAFNKTGLLFFTCLFLEKSEGFQFIQKYKGFKNTTTPQFRATLEVMTFFSCKVPKPKLDNSILELDMMNELSRAPKLLLERLSLDEQKKFITTANEAEEESENEPSITMKRHKDRFPYFALRYLDDIKDFDELRFQVKVGKIQCADYQKNIGGISQARNIWEPISNYERLGTIKENIEQNIVHPTWKNILKDIQQLSPQYQITGERIAIKFFDFSNEKKYPNNATKIIPQKNKGKIKFKVENVKPDAILSTYELQSLCFYHHLYKKGWIKKSAEQHIKDYLLNFKRFITEVQSGGILPVGSSDFRKVADKPYFLSKAAILEQRKQALQPELDRFGMKWTYLPDALREYLLGYQPIDSSFAAKQKWNAKIKATKTLLKDAEKGRLPRIGEMATFLAKDIVFFKPLDNNKLGKPNNEQYNELQRKIALFSTQKKELTAYLRSELKMIGKEYAPYAHPFLYRIRVAAIENAAEFYKTYLTHKVRWLEAQLKIHIRQNGGGIKEEQRIFKIDTKSGKDKEYLKDDAAIYLPRGLFNAAVVEALKNNGFEHQVKEGDSITHCIKVYFNDVTQTFYQKERTYKHWNTEQTITGDTKQIGLQLLRLKEQIAVMKQSKEKKREHEHEIQDLEQFHKEVMNTEKELRYLQSTDRMLWLMALELFKRNGYVAFDEDESKTRDLLAKVGFDEDENVLKTEVPMSIQVQGTKIVDTLPIRRYGEFRRFAKDRRLWGQDNSGLLYYFDDGAEIDRNYIVQELDDYNNNRVKFLTAQVYEFEKLLYEKHEQNLTGKITGNKYIEFRTQLAVFKCIYGTEFFQPFEEDTIVQFRNRALHNQIPYSEKLSEQVEKGKICEQLFSIAVEQYEKMIAALKKIDHSPST